jgi:hypothetical protein
VSLLTFFLSKFILKESSMDHIRTLKSKVIPSIAAAALALGGAGALHAQGGTSDQGTTMAGQSGSSSQYEKGQGDKGRGYDKDQGSEKRQGKGHEKGHDKGHGSGHGSDKHHMKGSHKKDMDMGSGNTGAGGSQPGSTSGGSQTGGSGNKY